MPPRDSTVRATVRVMSSALNTSQAMASALPPREVMVLAVATTFDSVRPASATPSPTPCPAPVTSASLPASSATGVGTGSHGRLHAREPVRGELGRLFERLDFL